MGQLFGICRSSAPNQWHTHTQREIDHKLLHIVRKPIVFPWHNHSSFMWPIFSHFTQIYQVSMKTHQKCARVQLSLETKIFVILNNFFFYNNKHDNCWSLSQHKCVQKYYAGEKSWRAFLIWDGTQCACCSGTNERNVSIKRNVVHVDD